MLIAQNFTWPAVFWPTSSGIASQYTLLQVYPNTSPTVITTVQATSATITLDDAVASAYQVRPSSGTAPGLTYGPEVTVFTVGYVPVRAWLRQKIRKALADRADSVGVTLNWPDDELNDYIQEGIGELNILFPVEAAPVSITLLSPTVDSHGNAVGVRIYSLPSDCYSVRTVEYVTADGKLHLYLKEKPWRGGETTATSYLGYPKLGILLSPLSGRFYPGHYFTYQGQLNLDWDPSGDGDYLNVTYLGRRAFPQNDGDIMNVQPEDMELLSLYTQMKCWLRVEGQDTRLSRWRDKSDGSRRDDLPTVKQSMIIKNLYDQRVNDRREMRPRVRRLVRR